MPGKARFLKRPVKLLRSLISRFRFRRDRTRKDDTALTINNGAKPPLSPAQVEPPTSDEPSTPTQLEVEPPARVELPVPAQVESNSSLQLSQPQDVDKPSQPPEFSADIFKGADIENIGGSFVTTVGIGNTIHHTTVQVRDNKAREMLRELVVRDAMHTGKVRLDPLACDPNTRQAIVERIIAWMEDNQRDNYVLWLCGPAGIGKSAIAKTTAERLDGRESSARVAGSFFFFRSDQKRNTLQSFVPTLAYRLAISMKAIGRKIYQVIEQDPEVLRSDVEVQWRQLIVETVISFHSLPPATMIIDGLDECGSTDDQRKILELVASCGPYFPISFLIASRPEPHIINSFDTEPLSLICQVVIDLVAYKDDQEMEMFVQASFSRIFTEHYDLLKSYSVDGVWPSDDIVDLITAKADGQFIYPVTLFKYIGEVYADPQERLMLCLEQNLEVLSPLDALYTQILQSSHEPDNTTIQDFLFLLFPAEDREAPTLQILSLILDLDTAEIRSYLRKLHSVVDIPEDDYNEIRIHHQSFIDFLLDSDRCSAYQINQRDSAIRIINGCLSALKKYPGSAGEVMPLLQTWWSCCRILSHEDVGPRLVSRMERLDFEGVLRVFPGNRGIEFIGSCYKDFIGTCQSWVSAGSSKESGTTEYWRNSSLLAKFKPDILVVAKEAQELSKQFKEFHKKLNDTFAYTCPISWNGLLILAQAELNHESSVLVTKRWKIGHITDNFVYSTLLLFCDENLVQKLRAKEDLMYLSTWSRCWAEHWKSHVSYSMNPYPDPRRIAELLSKLPKEHHYHELNGDHVLPWLQWTCDRFDRNPYKKDGERYRDLIKHWMGAECRRDSEGGSNEAGPDIRERENYNFDNFDTST